MTSEEVELFAERRERFMQQIGDGVALFFAAPEKVRSNDTQYRFRQDSYFHYLTGFEEPGAAAVLLPNHSEHRFVLFVRPRDPERETWDGRRAGPEGAKDRYGADEAYPMEKLPELLPGYLENVDRFHYSLGRQADRDREVMAAIDTVKQKVRLGVRAPSVFLDPAAPLSEMRLRKTSQELELMRRAARISREAHRSAMQALHPGMNEYEIEALIEYVFRRNGALSPAYSTIVGSGVNATILHYIENTAECRAGELLLIDAGAEYRGYCADITRTLPVSGTFTEPQRAVYEVVLGAQLKAIDRVRPGVRFDEVHQTALRELVSGLVRLGILGGELDSLITDEAYKPYFMHRTSHWLGLDVHDVGEYRNGESWRELEPGMVLTVEPGLYFEESREEVPERFRGMGVRIEDDVLVTDGEPEVLTAGTPKSPEEVEAAMAESLGGPVAPA
jgi:Xaa-Pro aminopeptidase